MVSRRDQMHDWDGPRNALIYYKLQNKVIMQA